MTGASETEPRASRGRVAVFTQRFLPYSQTFIYDELRHHRRYEAEVFTGPRLNRERFPFPQVHAPSGPVDGWLRDRLFYCPSHDRQLAAGGFDVLHAHFGLAAPYALALRVRHRIPLVVTFHGFDAVALSQRWRWGRWRYRAFRPAILRWTDRFLAASEELARILVSAGAPESRVRVWRLGVEIPPVAHRKRSTADRRVLMVGRFVEKKGFEFGIDAFAQVASDHPEVRLAIVGTGPREQALKTQVQRLGLIDRIEFLGARPHSEVLALMEGSAILLAPSVVSRRGDRESGLIVVKEAAARSVPAVASHHGGIPEIIDDGRTGYLVPERDASGLARGLSRLLSDEDHRRQLGAEARRKMIQEYDIQARVDALEQHYDEVRAGLGFAGRR